MGTYRGKRESVREKLKQCQKMILADPESVRKSQNRKVSEKVKTGKLAVGDGARADPGLELSDSRNKLKRIK